MFCTRGEAIITIDLRKYHIVPNTHITLLPSSIISLTSASKDFLVDFFAYSETMFKTACFRLEPPFIHFIKENACYTHTEDEPVRAITGLITASNAIYRDSENLYREAIAQNLLQIFFLDTYDKVQRYFTAGARETERKSCRGDKYDDIISLCLHREFFLLYRILSYKAKRSARIALRRSGIYR